MRRAISRLRKFWLIVVVVVFSAMVAGRNGLQVPFLESIPPLGLSAALFLAGIFLLVTPKTARHEPYVMAAPVRGRWAALNSPGQKLPSHGTRFLGQYAAVDILRPTDETTPAKIRRAWRGSRPADYPSFGAQVYSMAPGVVKKTSAKATDHRARNTWQGLLYLMTLEAVIRSLTGDRMILGNHVIVAHDDGTAAVYAHLRKDSLTVASGQRVNTGQQLGEVGNTGNSSEPHLHVHLMDRVNPHAAAGLMMVWDNITRSEEIEPSLKELAQEPAKNALRSMPSNGEIFEAHHPGL
ncbi:M23 family metallopeptidase [Corynebacterium alimapuense]|uniref:Peptidase M23 n=1 Tax=Corynebacterium alimapuense TaxID=1576874 RepID=A0A3M8K5V4_9CORY|nr:M23 family metallopeptidase [Corynebacterium alimapuense]RNE48249.1 peptidase M23 [Corynebacterium alimapuense]